MKVFNAGAVLAEPLATARSSSVAAYSNSNPTMSSPVPMARPLAGRAVGVVVLPRNPVISAAAGTALSSSRTRQKAKGRRQSLRILHDNLPSMDFRPSAEQEILRRTVREFAEAEMRPHVMEWDEAQHFSPDLLPKLAALGLTGI